MGTDKKHFLLKLIPPRTTFIADMNAAEAAVDDEATLHALLAHDPANGLSRYEVFPMAGVPSARQAG